MPETSLMSTREVAAFLGVNEKMVYTLISEKGLPATKVTGKWRFPRHLVERWIEANTVNYPHQEDVFENLKGLLVIAGSNDILLDRAMALYNRSFPARTVVFGNLGSLGGLQSLRRGFCHIAASHLIEEDGQDYNFGTAVQELGTLPVVVNFCRRRQGLIVAKGNPKEIESVSDLSGPGITIVNRRLGTGTRVLFDRELEHAGIRGESVEGYHREVERHLDAGLEILAGRADAAPGIEAVASLLNLDFIPWRWERFDLLMTRDRFFEPLIQSFLGLLHEKSFLEQATGFDGYDLSLSGKMVFPQEDEAVQGQPGPGSN